MLYLLLNYTYGTLLRIKVLFYYYNYQFLVQQFFPNGVKDTLLPIHSALNEVKHIRLFLMRSAGFGDVRYALDVLQRTVEILPNQQLIIEVIGHELALKKFFQLTNIDHANWEQLIKDRQSINLQEKLVITFIELGQYTSETPSKSDLAIFCTTPKVLVNEYQHKQKALTDISHANINLVINPFTWRANPGATICINDQCSEDYLSDMLSFKVFAPKSSDVQTTLKNLSVLQPEITEVLKSIITLREQSKLETFSIYGLNIVFHPKQQFNLFRFILSAITIKQPDKPLIIFAHNKISDTNWLALKDFFTLQLPSPFAQTIKRIGLPNNISFIDLTTHSVAINLLESTHTVVIKLPPSLPHKIFDYLIKISNFPVIFEGENLARQLLYFDFKKPGLYCARPQEHLMFLPTAYPLLPSDIIHTDICTSEIDFSAWQVAANRELPIQPIVTLMQKYKHDTLQDSNLVEQEKSYSLSFDKVNYLLYKTAELQCQQGLKTIPELCRGSFSNLIAPGDALILHSKQTALLASLEQGLTYGLCHQGYSTNYAKNIALSARIVTHTLIAGMVNHADIYGTTYLQLLTACLMFRQCLKFFPNSKFLHALPWESIATIAVMWQQSVASSHNSAILFIGLAVGTLLLVDLGTKRLLQAAFIKRFNFFQTASSQQLISAAPNTSSLESSSNKNNETTSYNNLISAKKTN
ncbi:MAG: hypothetical protein Tsb005_10580 [Gammaproteobacteria bacterium]